MAKKEQWLSHLLDDYKEAIEDRRDVVTRYDVFMPVAPLRKAEAAARLAIIEFHEKLQKRLNDVRGTAEEVETSGEDKVEKLRKLAEAYLEASTDLENLPEYIALKEAL